MTYGKTKWSSAPKRNLVFILCLAWQSNSPSWVLLRTQAGESRTTDHSQWSHCLASLIPYNSPCSGIVKHGADYLGAPFLKDEEANQPTDRTQGRLLFITSLGICVRPGSKHYSVSVSVIISLYMDMQYLQSSYFFDAYLGHFCYLFLTDSC